MSAVTSNSSLRLAATVRALAAAYGKSGDTMASDLGMSRATWYSRLNGTTEFTIGEAVALAALFRCTVDGLVSGHVSLRISVDDAPEAVD